MTDLEILELALRREADYWRGTVHQERMILLVHIANNIVSIKNQSDQRADLLIELRRMQTR